MERAKDIDKTLKITFITSSLGAGGSEKVIASLANYWIKEGKKIDILALTNEKASSFFPLSEGIKLSYVDFFWGNVNIFNKVIFFIQRLILIRKSIIKIDPDVIISFIHTTNIITLIATFGLRIPVIVSERSNPFRDELRLHWKIIRTVIYQLTDLLVLQTKGVTKYFKFISEKKIRIIANPLIKFNPEQNSVKKNLAPYILVVGSFRPVKQIDKVITTFKRVIEIFPEWKLFIIGDGNLKNEYLKLIENLKISSSVKILGNIKNPEEYFINAKILVMYSLYEGFPNVILEAMHYGLPVIASDCDFGPAEIIENEINGIIVKKNDAESLFNGMIDLINNPEKRYQISKQAQLDSKNFAIEKISKIWEEEIKSLMKIRN